MAYFDEVANGAKVFSENLGAASQHASATTTALHEASGQLTSFATILKGLATYAGMKLVTEQVLQIAKGSSEWVAKVRTANEAYRDAANELGILQEKLRRGEAVDAREYASLRAITQELQRHAALLDFKHKLSLTVNSALDEQGRIWLGALAIGATMLEKTTVASHNLNKVLIGTNSTLKVRQDLVDQILQAQQQTGATLENTGEAARALIGYGMQLSGSFKTSTEMVVQLKEGLGVSAETAAKLATVWERGIKQPMRDAADAVAEIAAGTGLTADRAAELVNSLGRSARLLGPDLQGSVARTAEMLGDIAGRIQGLGGNYQIPQDLLRRLSGGGVDSQMLRALGGAQSREDLTDAGKARLVLQNLAQSMRNMVSADPSKNFNLYSAQLDVAANYYKMSADDIRDFVEAMSAQQRAVAGARTAEEAYTAQQKAVGNAWKMLRESAASLVDQALLPLIRAVTPAIQGLASFVKAMSESKTAVYGMQIALYSSAVALVPKMLGLAASLATAARETALLSKGLELLGLGGAATNALNFLPWIKRIGGGGLIGSIVYGVSYGVGRVIDQAFPGNWIHTLATGIAEASYGRPQYARTVTRNELSATQARDAAAEALLKNNQQKASEILEEYARHAGPNEPNPFEVRERAAEQAQEQNTRREFGRQSTTTTIKTEDDFKKENQALDRRDEIEHWMRSHADDDRLIRAMELSNKLQKEQTDAERRRAVDADEVKAELIRSLFLQGTGGQSYAIGYGMLGN